MRLSESNAQHSSCFAVYTSALCPNSHLTPLLRPVLESKIRQMVLVSFQRILHLLLKLLRSWRLLLLLRHHSGLAKTNMLHVKIRNWDLAYHVANLREKFQNIEKCFLNQNLSTLALVNAAYLDDQVQHEWKLLGF